MAVLDFLYYPVSAVMWFWHQAFGLVLGPSSGVAWALSVVFLVLTLRALMIRPVLSQMRSAQRMRRIAPQLAELRKKHGRDRQKLAEETTRLHREHGVSPLGSFLPVLVQIPVFIALLHVLRYFNRPGLTFAQNAAIPNYVFGPDEVRSFLEARLFGAPLSAYVSMPQSLLDSFGAPVDRIAVVAVAVPLMLLAAVATHVTARRSLRQQPAADPQTAQVAGFMKLTPWLFPLGAIVGGLFFPFPIAILVYWLTSNAWTLGQQHAIGRIVAREQPSVPVRVPAAAPRPGQKPIRKPGGTAARVRRGA
ncbi:membrane protein insertase YidC [Pseudonocardia kujensis]|uniref:membrane protein insertase YidC n=1 Tax=Pseudonocardia kujensis TaxID=1128675 RepID=UPI001E54F32D|nr:membrane protein insertase YidC [Pseudonocardia kujensis]MCE0766514.1 membrane protein insertase YidC [Pseudonocardia kujensis]